MAPPPSLRQMVSVFGRIGVLSFGGPAAQISLMHRELVQNRPWLDEAQFLRALSFCMLLPGPEAMQLATYAGWRLRGVTGGVLAGLLFVMPGAVLVAALAALYIGFGAQPSVQAAFLGIKAAVLVVVLNALLALSRRSLKGRAHWLLAAGAFLALFVLALPFPLVIALAGLWGFSRAPVRTHQPAPATVALRATLGQVGFWGALWVAPLAVLWLLEAQFLLDLSLFFAQLAVVTLGGAYAVLS
ncbi:MAG: chromate transporter [Lutimaribacter sp.]